MDMSFEVGEAENRLGEAIVRARDSLRRRWRTFLALVVLVCAAGTVWVMMMDPRYEAVARLRLDPARDPMVDAVQERQALSPEAIQTEVSMLNSTDLGLDVVKRLNLRSDPRFRSGVRGDLNASDIDKAIAAKLLSNLEVSRRPLTYIIDVKYLSGDPSEAARIANAFMDSYFDRKLSSSTGTAARQAEFLRVQLKDIGSEARQAEAEVAQYRSAAGIVVKGTGNQSGLIVDEQIGPLSSQIAMAESAAAAAEATYAAALQQQSTAGVDSVPDVRNSPVIADLRRARADILRNIGENNTRYGEKHPESVRSREQLAVVDGQIQAEAQRIVSSLGSDARTARARLNSLRSKMASLEAERRAAGRASVVADSLQSEASAKRAAYDRMSQMAATTSQAARNPMVQAEIVDRARVPSFPVSPNRPLLLTLVLLTSLAAGTGTIAVRELLTPGLRTAEQIETKLGLPLLTAIPKVAGSKLTRETLLQPSASPFSEALRIAKAVLLPKATTSFPKVIAFPSALPGEGKSTTALAFAGVMAASGCKTLLLECDLRRAALRPILEMEIEAPGLVEVLSGQADVSEAIIPSGAEHLDLLLVRKPHFTASDLFGSGAMEGLLDQLKSQYELIVLDVPPLVGLADSRLLTVLADINVLVIQWERTPEKALISAMSSLRADGSNVAGALYTMADASSDVVGGLYYRRRYLGYYQSAEV
jgi:capsular exopolysaccharide synthesis family protein